MTCHDEFTRRGVEPEGNNVVRILIGYQQEFTGRGDHEVPGGFSLRALMPNTGERAVHLVNGVDHDTSAYVPMKTNLSIYFPPADSHRCVDGSSGNAECR